MPVRWGAASMLVGEVEAVAVGMAALVVGTVALVVGTVGFQLLGGNRRLGRVGARSPCLSGCWLRRSSTGVGLLQWRC
jgi:hypothetical protein